MLLVGLMLAIRTEQFVRRSVVTHGTVLRNELIVDRDSKTYAPVFEFAGADGQPYTVTSRVSSSPPDFQSGQMIQIRYEMKNPQSARPDSFGQLWGVATVLSVVGFVLMSAGIGLLVFARK
jgi:hypothetical protein